MAGQAPQQKQPSILGAFAIGSFSVITSKTVAAPLDRAKVLLQVQGVPRRYNGFFDCIQRVQEEEGVLAFWKGNMLSCMKYFPSVIINFTLKPAIINMFPKPDPNTNFVASLAIRTLAGAVGGLGSLLLTYPLDFAHLILMTDNLHRKKFTGVLDVLSKTVSANGVSALYAGMFTSFCGMTVYQASYRWLYDTLHRLFIGPKKCGHSLGTIATRFMLAQVTITVAGLIAYPLDTIRRRLMLQAVLPLDDQPYTGALDCASSIVREEGWSALWIGAGVNIARGVSSALMLVMYDQLKMWLVGDGQQQQQQQQQHISPKPAS